MWGTREIRDEYLLHQPQLCQAQKKFPSPKYAFDVPLDHSCTFCATRSRPNPLSFPGWRRGECGVRIGHTEVHPRGSKAAPGPEG